VVVSYYPYLILPKIQSTICQEKHATVIFNIL